MLSGLDSVIVVFVGLPLISILFLGIVNLKVSSDLVGLYQLVSQFLELSAILCQVLLIFVSLFSVVC